MHEVSFRPSRLKSASIFAGYALFLFWTCVALPKMAAARSSGLSDTWRGLVCLGVWLTSALSLAWAIANFEGKPERARNVLVFVILPFWGLILNAGLTGACRVDFDALEYRPLACPEVYGLLLLHLPTAASFVISRQRFEVLPPRVEPWLVALLLGGLLLNVVLAIQLFELLPWLVLFPLALPVITPFVLAVMFFRELSRRLKASAARAQNPVMLGPALLRVPALLGAYALLQALWRGHATGALDVFARTCTHPFSALTLQIKYTGGPGGHYLCTVAAQGHPGLVRPERLGVRRGQIIVVNRQLAIANAFEDLLKMRWPRLARAARAAYDRLAIPICHLIANRWLADLVYLAMKPAEWFFYLALLALDRDSPEARIERMYR